MGLLDLPPEILDIIIDATAPSGLESFVLSCKAIFERAKSQILHHNELKRRWGHASNASPARRGDTLSILHEISREPVIAEYIKSLSLWDRRTEDEVGQAIEGYNFREDEHAMKDIKYLLRSAEYYSTSDQDEWWQQIQNEDAVSEESHVDKLYATVALLTLLPNIEVLQLPDRWHEVRKGEAAESLVPAVESLITMSNASRRRLCSLGSLETILPFVEEGYDVRAGLQCLQPFMSLKSVRSLFAVSCVAVEDDWGEVPFEWPNREVQSPLTRIELASCCMDASGLSVLLRNTPALTIFRYSHQTKWDGLEYDWNPGEFIEALANYCGPRLLELAITIDELHGEVINGLSSFMRFSSLQKLEVDVAPFCGPPLESGQSLGRNAHVPYGSNPWTHLDIPCMGDMLPPSIRELHVNTDYPDPSEDALKALFKNIKDRRQDKLLKLEKTVIRQYRSSSAQDMANAHGAILEVFDEHVAEARPRSMMPEWKRAFDVRVGGIVMTTND
ncbi:hypothetical protein BDU57DRAFT_495923 [Ampelomyces quisqualis]|uniref:F-box domain-containing protein n=1 Tax=Ampelomyces quisqualis TaxID=50730 RepID=A0A6A5QKG9_AMPQU|nr:hypothetical protein BDU57DRAFT_495923 [Ampelomyces quisqualis]